jgi:phospholipase C
MSTGQTMGLTQEPDIIPNVAHSVEAQTTAIDGGKMDGFDRIQGCTAADNYACYTQVSPSQIPNLAALARGFVISDRTFEETDSPSFGGHIALAASQLDGFQGDAPGQPSGAGWGCDSNLTAPWINPSTLLKTQVPACIPRPDGSGPFAPSPVAFVPTIMDRLDAAGYPWRIYDGDYGTSHAGYAWAVCPMFANCLYSADDKGMTSEQQIIQDANQNALPSLSLVIPAPIESQHNSDSITQGDNWIGSVVSAIEHSPDWDSTAIFITYDDCGCFYDHVAPPPGLGIRVPMVIVSPYARAAYTDSTVASFASVLAYTEHTLDVPSLNGDDSSAYDYSGSFDYTQAPLPPVPLVTRPVPPASLRYMKAHPLSPDDPT